MFPLGDIWDAVGGGAFATIIGALSYGYVRVFRARHEVVRDDRDAVLVSQTAYISTQSRREDRLRRMYDSLMIRYGRLDDKERRCQRRVDRLRLVVQAIDNRLTVYEAAMRESQLPTMSKTRIEVDYMQEDEEDRVEDDPPDAEDELLTEEEKP